MNIQENINKAHQIATEHGFHDEKRSNEHWLMLVISEVCELMEAHRKDHWPTSDCGRESFESREYVHPDFNERYDAYVKGTIGEELADICIRIFDFMGETGMTENDMLGCTMTNDELPDNCKTFPEQTFELITLITHCWTEIIICHATLQYCKYWANKFCIDLDWHINTKMQYNQNRPRLHGKMY